MKKEIRKGHAEVSSGETMVKEIKDECRWVNGLYFGHWMAMEWK